MNIIEDLITFSVFQKITISLNQCISLQLLLCNRGFILCLLEKRLSDIGKMTRCQRGQILLLYCCALSVLALYQLLTKWMNEQKCAVCESQGLFINISTNIILCFLCSVCGKRFYIANVSCFTARKAVPIDLTFNVLPVVATCTHPHNILVALLVSNKAALF